MSESPADIEARLREVKAQRAAMQTEREAREEASSAERELQAELRALRDEKALNDAIEEHGPVDVKIATIQTAEGLIIVKRPGSARARKFQDKGSFQTADILSLARPCVVYPDFAEFDRILEELPFTLTLVGNAVVKLAGLRASELEKK